MQRTLPHPQGEVLISPGEGETYDSNTTYEGEEGQEEGERSDDWYSILGVDTKASQSDIKDAYHKLVRVYHPDKIIRARTMSDPNIPREEIQNVRQDAIERFNKITQAYDVLGDPIQRAMYDYVYGVRAESTEERLHFNSMRRKLAEGAVALMEETVIAIREQEQAKSGLLILEGRYGDLTSKQGNYIDVTVPLQCMVMDSSLIIQPGNSKQWLEGFYEPTINTECELYIRYKFLNKMHQVTVGDMDKLIIPLQEHLMSDQEANRVDQQSRNKSLVVKRLKKRRRYMLYTSLVLAIGYYLIRTNRIKLPFGWTLPALPIPNVPTTFISTWQTWFERKPSQTSTPAITTSTPALSSSLTMASSRLS